ncbi:MAG: ribonuclease Y [Omnitrophica bacterium RIFCSPHIGHO2_02_FULL_51_18]|nr:MAG: ribonuclease Y [Omnitrophica bacterium RIFCSPHIGHO2_02_FULL_51_18]
MDTGILLLFIGLGGVIAGVFFGVGFFVRKIFAERLIRTAESKAREILVNAKREAEDTVKKADKEAKQYLFKIQSEFDTKVAEERRRLENLEKVLSHKEGQIDQKVDLIEKREKEALYRLQEAVSKEKIVIDRERETEKLLQAQREALKKISNINAEEAKREFLKRLEIDMRADSSKIIREIEKEAHELADQKAKKILSLAIQRAAAAHTIESTVTAVALPNEEMKGRIIGKDGKNIRTFETLTGVDLVIDETPNQVTLSAFDGVRREVARLSLEELVKDGRIQPARIEEVVQKTKRNMENVLKEEGEKAISEVGLSNVHPEIVKLLGRLRYRSSYGQNVLDHSIEVAFIMNVIAGEMKIDPVLARRAGLLHDLGKAVSSDVEGPHALIGGELARRYGEHPDVIHAVEAHHEDIEMKSYWPMLVQAADAVSAARPGARRESFETYIKRLTSLEEIADKHPGVEKSYAIQAGRELRVVVRPDKVPEDTLPALAREITKKIQENLTFPGQIKVVVIRETRVEDVAK